MCCCMHPLKSKVQKNLVRTPRSWHFVHLVCGDLTRNPVRPFTCTNGQLRAMGKVRGLCASSVLLKALTFDCSRIL